MNGALGNICAVSNWDNLLERNRETAAPESKIAASTVNFVLAAAKHTMDVSLL